MAVFLEELGLGFLAEGEQTIMSLLEDVAKHGKPIIGYSGILYMNQHYGSTQVVARVVLDKENEKLELVDFDTHADSLCAWKLRIIDRLSNYANEPGHVKLLAESSKGENAVQVDVINGDILPSFLKGEEIELQMIAFSNHVEFFGSEEEYTESLEPGHNGMRLRAGHNTLLPIGIFSDNEDMKDLVQIHGEIKKLNFGTSVFNDERFQTNIRCHVDTQFGEIVVVFPFDDIEEIRNNPHLKEGQGKVIDCYARLSGDAAIFDHEDGIVKDAENNLKLVAYTLVEGDPARLRPILSDCFEYYSESSGKRFDDADAYIDFVREVHENRQDTYTKYATIVSIDDGPDEPEYPVGTRCAVIGYTGDKGYNAIVFVDTDGEGKIKRIYLCRESRYHFRVDEPVKEPFDLEKAIATTTYRKSMIGRAHLFDVIGQETDETEIDRFFSNHAEEIHSAISDLLDGEMSPDAFSEAFIRGVFRSNIEDYDERDLAELGKQFHTDFTLFKPEEQLAENFPGALALVFALGMLYVGRKV